MKCYVASSWSNDRQPRVVELLRLDGHDVYDFRHPDGQTDVFLWESIDPGYTAWSPSCFVSALNHDAARKKFCRNYEAMLWSDVGILVLPCGRSAHLEAGYFIGADKPLYILMIEPDRPELMYAMATKICTRESELLDALNVREWRTRC